VLSGSTTQGRGGAQLSAAPINCDWRACICHSPRAKEGRTLCACRGRASTAQALATCLRAPHTRPTQTGTTTATRRERDLGLLCGWEGRAAQAALESAFRLLAPLRRLSGSNGTDTVGLALGDAKYSDTQLLGYGASAVPPRCGRRPHPFSRQQSTETDRRLVTLTSL
jgi:hypothetical protein